MNDIKLRSLTVKGYKSIKEIDSFEPKAINILIGPNGAGKSNFISFFTLLSWMLNSDGKLQEHVAYLGGANDMLHDGVDMTKTIDVKIEIETHNGINIYQFSLMFAKPDKLVFKEEKYGFTRKNRDGELQWFTCGVGHEEAKLPEIDYPTSKIIMGLLRKFVVYQFHNTSDTAPMRLSWSISDSRWLRQNGENLASYLYRIYGNDRAYYTRILKYIRLVLPFFDDFVFYPEFDKILLRWREKGTNKEFNAGQASDGMLRTIALITLLGQNPNDLPAVLFLDEPELGLHPSAIDTVSAMIKAASSNCQIFIATQSVGFINNFELDDLVSFGKTLCTFTIICFGKKNTYRLGQH